MENPENIELEYMEELMFRSDFGIGQAESFSGKTWDIPDNLKKKVKDEDDNPFNLFDDDDGKKLYEYNPERTGERETHVM